MKTKLLKRLRKETAQECEETRVCSVCGKTWYESEMFSSTPCCGALSYIPYPDEYILRRVEELKQKRRGNIHDNPELLKGGEQ